MKRILTFLNPFVWAIGLAYKASPRLFLATSSINMFISSLSGIISSYVVAQTTASVALLATGQVNIRTPIMWAVAFGVISLFFDVLRRINDYFDTLHNTKLELLINSMFASKVSSFTQEQLDDPELQTKLGMSKRELYSVRRASSILQNMLSAFVAYSFAIIVVWRYSWQIATLLMVLIPLLAINSHYQVKRRRKSWEDGSMYWRISNGLYGYITEPLRLFQIRIMGAREKILELYRLNIEKANSIELVAERKNILLSLISDIVSPLIDMGTRIWAIVLIAGGKLAFDQFLFVIGMIQQANSQTFLIGYTLSDAQETYLATNALKTIMDYPLPPDGGKKLPVLDGKSGLSVNLRNVSLTYADGTEALSGVSLDIPSGAKVALVGENGAGKSSILRLIMRQYEPTAGDIFINGLLASDVKRNSLYKHISALTQDYYLFNDLTIRENISISSGQPIGHAKIKSLLDTVSLTEKVSRLKHGLDTRLDKSYDDGTDLSGGQMQRLAIARALSKDYQLMILDEPTSAIDAKAERAIFNRLFKEHDESSMIIVSHRFATVRKADYIYVMDKGKIVEQGTHEDLMALDGLYSELYTIQAEDFR